MQCHQSRIKCPSSIQSESVMAEKQKGLACTKTVFFFYKCQQKHEHMQICTDTHRDVGPQTRGHEKAFCPWQIIITANQQIGLFKCWLTIAVTVPPAMQGITTQFINSHRKASLTGLWGCWGMGGGDGLEKQKHDEAKIMLHCFRLNL